MYEDLIQEAIKAREQAYTPYSSFRVGAAVQTASGQIFHGCNIENSSYGATTCAERIALFNAYVQQDRDIAVLAVVADTDSPCPPCGICRQVILELAGDIPVILANLKGVTKVFKASELLPEAFDKDFL